MKKILSRIGTLFLMLCIFMALQSCRTQTAPQEMAAVQNFDAQKYLGKWYEIARLDYSHERNMNNTTAEYSLNEDSTIKVVNRGFNYKKNEEEEATGKAKFVDNPTVARLKVSFFGPFYSGYNVIALDPDYKYALVAGESLKYLWILSRETTLPETIKEDYLRQAQSLGYDTSQLIWVEHNR